MKIDFKAWNFGGKLIFIAACLAILSLFMSWVDIGFATASGFQQEGYLLLVFYLYPVIKLLREKPMKKSIGVILGILSVVSGILFMLSKSVDFFGTTVNTAGVGLYLFIIASILLTVGVIKYDVTVNHFSEAAESE